MTSTGEALSRSRAWQKYDYWNLSNWQTILSEIFDRPGGFAEGFGSSEMWDCVVGWVLESSTLEDARITYLLTPCSRVLLQKPTDSQPVKFPAFYGTRMFITAFTSARHLSLSWATNHIHNIYSLHIFTVCLLHVWVLYTSSSRRTYVHFT